MVFVIVKSFQELDILLDDRVHRTRVVCYRRLEQMSKDSLSVQTGPQQIDVFERARQRDINSTVHTRYVYLSFFEIEILKPLGLLFPPG